MVNIKILSYLPFIHVIIYKNIRHVHELFGQPSYMHILEICNSWKSNWRVACEKKLYPVIKAIVYENFMNIDIQWKKWYMYSHDFENHFQQQKSVYSGCQ
jgi:hypothetical protein